MNNAGGSPIFGRILDDTRRVKRLKEVSYVFGKLSHTDPDGTINKQA